MDTRNRWPAFRGRLLVFVGVIALLTAMFLPQQIPEPFAPLIVVFGVGFIARLQFHGAFGENCLSGFAAMTRGSKFRTQSIFFFETIKNVQDFIHTWLRLCLSHPAPHCQFRVDGTLAIY